MKDGFIKFDISCGLCFGRHTVYLYMLKVSLNLIAYRIWHTFESIV